MQTYIDIHTCVSVYKILHCNIQQDLFVPLQHSKNWKFTLVILVLYVSILKAVVVFKEFLQCLAGNKKKKAYLFRPTLQGAEDGET